MSASGKTPAHVLLVDDNEHLLVTLGDYLAFSGFTVTRASSGEEALRLLDRETPDVIVLDISMPGMGGIGFLKRITGEDGRPRHPIVVLTARSSMESFFQTLEVDAFIAKPCTGDQLVSRISEVLERRAAQMSAALPHKRRLLLAEDDEEHVRNLKMFFTAAGYDVESVGSGPEVLERASVAPPDVILMKEILPRMNGGAVASLVSTMTKTRAIPVVLYDDTRAGTDRLRYGSKAHEGVKRYLNTAEPATLLAAVALLFQD